MTHMHHTLGRLVFAGVVFAAPLVTPLPAQQDRGRGDDRSRIDTTFAFDKSGEVNLSLPAGEIRVTAWARAEARVVATSERGLISSSFSPNRLRLEVRSRGNTGRTRYDVSVPIGVRVNATVASGTINVSGTRGALSLTSASGTITASDATGRSEIETASGRIVLQRFDGTTKVSAMSGQVDITDVAGDLSMEVVSGTVRIDRARLEGFQFESASGSLDFAGTLAAQGRHDIQVNSGTVTLRFPAGFGATIELESFRGELQSPDFPVTLRPSGGNDRGRNSERQQYAINGGGARITIDTFSGGVFLRQIGASERR
jgi:hypothetical protein